MEDNNKNNAHSEPALEEVEQSEVSAKELEICSADRDMWKDRCMRATADFQNFQHRAEKERALVVDLAQEKILRDLLLVFDDVDRALSIPAPDHQDVQSWITGFEMIRKGIVKTIEKYGVVPFASYDQFDPELHEGIMQVEDSGKESGAIVQVLQKGFMYKNKVLRAAKVSVAK